MSRAYVVCQYTFKRDSSQIGLAYTEVRSCDGQASSCLTPGVCNRASHCSHLTELTWHQLSYTFTSLSEQPRGAGKVTQGLSHSKQRCCSDRNLQHLRSRTASGERGQAFTTRYQVVCVCLQVRTAFNSLGNNAFWQNSELLPIAQGQGAQTGGATQCCTLATIGMRVQIAICNKLTNKSDN